MITWKAYAASHRAAAEMKSARSMSRGIGVRAHKCLNNIVEQDHRPIKRRIGPTLGFKRFDSAAITICGIELAAMIRKQQFKIGKLPGRSKTAPEIWVAVLAA